MGTLGTAAHLPITTRNRAKGGMAEVMKDGVVTDAAILSLYRRSFPQPSEMSDRAQANLSSCLDNDVLVIHSASA